MLNKPRLDMIEQTSQLLAGEKFPANQQCELIFGPNSKVCPFPITVSIYGQQVDQVSGMARKKPIRIHILAHFVDRNTNSNSSSFPPPHSSFECINLLTILIKRLLHFYLVCFFFFGVFLFKIWFLILHIFFII